MSTVGNWRGPDIVKDGLVLYMDAGSPNSYFNPVGGVTWKDISGNGNNATLTNGAAFNPVNGGSIAFDGIDDRVSRDSAINTGQNFTVSAWIYPTLLGTTRRAIVADSYPYSSREGWMLCTAGFSTNNTFFLSIGQDNAYKTAAANTLNVNEWVYVSGICINGGESINLYKNGIIITSFANLFSTTGTITYTTNQFNVGFRLVGGNEDPYTGNISVVHLYNRALSATEILQNYNATKTRFGL